MVTLMIMSPAARTKALRRSVTASGSFRKMALLQNASVLAVSCLMARNSFGGSIRDDTPDSQYLNLAAQPAYASVGEVVQYAFNGSDGLADFRIPGNFQDTNGWASCVLVAPGWVLTAGHVVHHWANFYQSGGYVTINGNSDYAGSMSVYLNGVGYGVSESFTYSEFTGDVGDGMDISLMRIGGALNNLPAPATLDPNNIAVGSTITAVGYGATGNGLTGIQANLESILNNISGYGNPGNISKRAVQNVISGNGTSISWSAVAQTQGTTLQFNGKQYYDEIPDPPFSPVINYFAGPTGNATDLVTSFVAPTSPGSVPPLPLEGITTTGDSGGGWFTSVNGAS
jgi:hypothetical protein